MIQFTSITKVAGGWYFAWAAPTPAPAFYRVVLWGRDIGHTLTTGYKYEQPGSTQVPPPLEVVSENTQAASEVDPPYFMFQWYIDPPASDYAVSQLVGTAWKVDGTVADTGSWVYSYTTGWLADQTHNRFRVVANDAYGNRSAPQEYDDYIVCPPEPPVVDVRYEGGNIVIS